VAFSTTYLETVGILASENGYNLDWIADCFELAEWTVFKPLNSSSDNFGLLLIEGKSIKSLHWNSSTNAMGTQLFFATAWIHAQHLIPHEPNLGIRKTLDTVVTEGMRANCST